MAATTKRPCSGIGGATNFPAGQGAAAICGLRLALRVAGLYPSAAWRANFGCIPPHYTEGVPAAGTRPFAT